MLCPIPASPQARVAEGEYQLTSSQGAPAAKTATQWVLTSNRPGRFHLESEILNQPTGMRVVQVEELDEKLVPVAIGHELYREDQKHPDIVATCAFAAHTVTCNGRSGKDKAEPSPPYKFAGPFWLWIEGLFSLDMPWLLDGAVNMAHLDQGKADVISLTVSGGSGVMIGDAVSVAKLKAVQQPGQKLFVVAPSKPIPWDFNTDETSPLEFVGSESVDLEGTKVSTRHYTFTNGGQPMHLWIAPPGILVKLAQGDGDGDFVLTHYKQYRSLIPELPVEPQTSANPRQRPD
jgi:hypothetical protein